MTPEAQRIAIAEALGWTDIQESNHRLVGFPYCQPDEEDECWSEGVPDYLNDLNAMDGALNSLNVGQAQIFIKHLDDILRRINRGGTWEMANSGDEDYICHRIFSFVHATATQRAEAFLRTLNLWKP